MQYKRLGRTEVDIPVIGQGCMGIGGFFDVDDSQDEHFVRALRAGIEAGLTFLDTAEAYGGGHSEELVGQAAAERRDKVFIATKVSPEHLGSADLERAAEASLRRLNSEWIDLYQVHWPNPSVLMAETMAALERLVKRGLVRFIGLSNFSAQGVRNAQAALTEHTVQSVQAEYNLFDRSVEEEMLPFCDQEGMTFIAYTPLDKGIVLKEGRRAARLNEIAQEYDKTAAQIALQWLVSHPAVVAIPKASSLAHARENAAAADFTLSAEHRVEIARLFEFRPVYLSPQEIQTDQKNLDRFIPGPAELAQTLKDGEPLKPVRVVPNTGQTSPYPYTLVEGKLRYWAWVQAFGGQTPIPALIRGE
jgi:aryl-alcohol dehydrogenase-like predicted oxidoreductase